MKEDKPKGPILTQEDLQPVHPHLTADDTLDINGVKIEYSYFKNPSSVTAQELIDRYNELRQEHNNTAELYAPKAYLEGGRICFLPPSKDTSRIYFTGDDEETSIPQDQPPRNHPADRTFTGEVSTDLGGGFSVDQQALKEGVEGFAKRFNRHTQAPPLENAPSSPFDPLKDKPTPSTGDGPEYDPPEYGSFGQGLARLPVQLNTTNTESDLLEYMARGQAQKNPGQDDFQGRLLLAKLGRALVAELPPDTVVVKYMSFQISAGEMIDRLDRLDPTALEWVSDVYRLARDFTIRKKGTAPTPSYLAFKPGTMIRNVDPYFGEQFYTVQEYQPPERNAPGQGWYKMVCGFTLPWQDAHQHYRVISDVEAAAVGADMALRKQGMTATFDPPKGDGEGGAK